MGFLKQRKQTDGGQYLEADLGHLDFFLPLGHTQDPGPAPWGDPSAATTTPRAPHGILSVPGQTGQGDGRVLM